MSNADTDYVEYVDEKDEAEASDYAGGSTPAGLSLPDETPRIEKVNELTTAIAKAIAAERDNWAAGQKVNVRVNPNLSGQVLFARFTVTSAQPIQIVREKDLRGDITIVNHSASDSVFIGLHAGIMHHGTDTGEVGPGASRVIRTRNALWAISMTNCDIDVQEEFD